VVLAETPRMQATMLRYLRWRNVQANKPRPKGR